MIDNATIFDELKRVKTSASGSDDGFYSTEEIADALGISTKTVLAKLRLLNKESKLETKQKTKTNISGRVMTYPTYRIKQAENDNRLRANDSKPRAKAAKPRVVHQAVKQPKHK